MSATITLTAAAVEELVKKYLDENLDARVDARLDARLDSKLEESRKALLSDLVKMLPSGVAAKSAAPAEKPSKKAEKAVDPSAPPKEKRAPNAWILFTLRVEKLVREAERAAEETRAAETPEEPKKAPLHTMVTKQFASELKSRKAYDEWTDEEIVEALATWTPPETSKRATAKAASAASEAGSVAEEAEKPAAAGAPAAEKPKRQWSEETKAAAAAKRAATLAAKKAAGAPAAEEPAAAEPVVAEAAAEAAPVKKTIAIKPKTVVAAPAPTEKPVDLSFYLWTHEGKSYYTNDRGDVVTTDFEWVGRFDGKTLDEKVEEPADLANATLRE